MSLFGHLFCAHASAQKSEGFLEGKGECRILRDGLWDGRSRPRWDRRKSFCDLFNNDLPLGFF
jgi:hypothetical protein